MKFQLILGVFHLICHWPGPFVSYLSNWYKAWKFWNSSIASKKCKLNFGIKFDFVIILLLTYTVRQENVNTVIFKTYYFPTHEPQFSTDFNKYCDSGIRRSSVIWCQNRKNPESGQNIFLDILGMDSSSNFWCYSVFIFSNWWFLKPL